MKKNLLILLGIAVPAFGLVSALACYLLEPKPDPIDVAALFLPRDTGSPMAVVPAVNDPDPPESDKQLVACLRAPGNGGIWDIAITPDGKVLATTCGDSTIKLWNLQRRKLIAATLTGHDNPDGPIAISPDGKSLAWGRNHGQVQFWDLRRNIETLCLRGHSDRITALCFSRDGSLLTSASRDEVVRVWELTHRVAKLKLASGMEYPTSLSFSPDGRRLACAGQARFVRIWDLPSG